MVKEFKLFPAFVILAVFYYNVLKKTTQETILKFAFQNKWFEVCK